MKAILQKEAAVLREKAKEVPADKISSAHIKKVIEEMKEALESQDDGVAIAAPQLGYSLRIFVVSHRVADIVKKVKKTDTTHKNATASDLIFINPVIKKLSKEKKTMEEGCLSIRYLYGRVKRSQKAVIEAYDEHGKKRSLGASGLLAQIFQHETDHLDGVLFTDKAKNIEEIPPVKIHAE